MLTPARVSHPLDLSFLVPPAEFRRKRVETLLHLSCQLPDAIWVVVYDYHYYYYCHFVAIRTTCISWHPQLRTGGFV